MAKHIIDGKGKASKGIRTSCYGNKRPGSKPQVGNHNNAMRESFMETNMPDRIRFSRMGNAIIKAAQQPLKLTADQVKGWSTKLSFRTFKALQEQGVLA